MKITMTRRLRWAVPFMAAVLLAGCGTLSSVSRDGKTDEPVFPDRDDVVLSDGTFPNLDNLAQVQEGVTRDQIYNLIGRPHFSEGFHVREWDYLFHFRTPDGIHTCQFKILFDSDKIARSFYWAPEDCRPGETPASQKYTLNSDVSFAFGSATMTAVGQARIAEIAGELRDKKSIDQLQIVGHTDRIGSDASNDVLSQRRAEAVRQTMIDSGVPAGNVRAMGRGERDPLVQCDQQDRSKLIACLAPNRRVEIIVSGTR